MRTLKTELHYVCTVALVGAPEHHTELQGLLAVDFFLYSNFVKLTETVLTQLWVSRFLKMPGVYWHSI